MNQRYVLTTVKLKDLLSLFVIGLHKVQTQNLLFTFTWNVKRAQNNFVPIFNSKVGVRLIHECDLYSSKYGKLYMPTTTKTKLNIRHSIHVRIQHDKKYIIDCILNF